LIQKHNNINILIVEDEVILAMALELSLKKIGFFVTGIEDTPSNAILHAQNKHPDIILMDINLNCKDTGIEAANIIWEKFKIPIIFLTSYSDDTTIKDAMKSEPYGYLIKPCRDEELKAVINMALNKHHNFFANKNSIKESNDKYIHIEGKLKFNKDTSVLYQNDEKVNLTRNEKKLFEILTKDAGNIVNFNLIYSYIWREDLYNLGKLRTLIYRLKIKLKCNLFENMYEEGYKIKVNKSFA